MPRVCKAIYSIMKPCSNWNIEPQDMTKKLRIKKKAPKSYIRRDQVCVLTCKSVVFSRACTLGCYFLGN